MVYGCEWTGILSAPCSFADCRAEYLPYAERDQFAVFEELHPRRKVFQLVPKGMDGQRLSGIFQGGSFNILRQMSRS